MQTPDEIIHQPVRLKIMAALNTLQSGQWLEFVALRAIVQATDGNLGAHLGTLESAGYVVVKKDFVGRKPRTRICLRDRKSTRLNSSHVRISYAVFCLKKKKMNV